MSPRHIIRIELSPVAKNRLATLSDKHGMTQVAMMSRLVEWFSSQPEEIQAAVVGRYPSKIAPDIARMLLKRMAS